ncbi:MAG TPA: NAD(P)H-binding protein [Streptosporangiaceae bacterium]|nr:NAD(P)H-binding protein [Streptosporangiaceae bacterium]
MRIALFGGTGRIGSHVLGWALEGGHQVTVLARDPRELGILARDPGELTVLASDSAGLAVPCREPAGTAVPAGAVTVVTGDVTDPAAVREVVDGADAVLSALGPRGARTPGLLGTAARNITTAMTASGARRLVCVSAAGAFIQADPDAGALVKMIVPRIWATPFADVRDMEAVVAASGLDWTMVRATRLVDGARTGRYRVRPDFPPAGGRKISRADVAGFMGAVVTEGNWVRARPALAY